MNSTTVKICARLGIVHLSFLRSSGSTISSEIRSCVRVGLVEAFE